jgi:hypothetical protein
MGVALPACGVTTTWRGKVGLLGDENGEMAVVVEVVVLVGWRGYKRG